MSSDIRSLRFRRHSRQHDFRWPRALLLVDRCGWVKLDHANAVTAIWAPFDTYQWRPGSNG